MFIAVAIRSSVLWALATKQDSSIANIILSFFISYLYKRKNTNYLQYLTDQWTINSDSLIWRLPFRSEGEQELEVDAGHGTRHHGEIFFVKEVVDDEFGGEIEGTPPEEALERKGVHVVSREIAREGFLTGSLSVTAGVVEPFVMKGPVMPREAEVGAGRHAGHVRDLMAEAIVSLGIFASDGHRGSPGEIAVDTGNPSSAET